MTVTSATAAGSATDTSALGRARLADNFNTFLTLLTTQMKNQDPLSPLDSNQFTQQLVQMTGVEQQLAANDLLKQLVANSSGTIASAVDMIGKTIRADSADASLVDGKAQWTYHLDADAKDVKIEVLDANGQTVDLAAPSTAENAAGDHTFTWDGRNLAGQPMPSGTYTLRITAPGADGASASVGHIFVQGPASAVEQANGQTLITVKGVKIPLGQVTSVTQAASAVSNTNSTTTNNNNTADQTSAAAA